MFGDIGQQLVVQRLVRDVAVLGVTKNRDIAVNAQHGNQNFQIRPMVLAVTIGDLKWLFGRFIVPIDTDRSGIEMHLACIDIELPDGILG